MCRKILELGRQGRRTLVYSLTADAPDPTLPCAGVQYGVRVEIAESGEAAERRRVTGDRLLAERMLDRIATGAVTPVTLGDVAEDLLVKFQL